MWTIKMSNLLSCIIVLYISWLLWMSYGRVMHLSVQYHKTMIRPHHSVHISVLVGFLLLRFYRSENAECWYINLLQSQMIRFIISFPFSIFTAHWKTKFFAVYLINYFLFFRAISGTEFIHVLRWVRDLHRNAYKLRKYSYWKHRFQ